TRWWACSTSTSAGPCRCCWPTGGRASSSSATPSWPCPTPAPARPPRPARRRDRPQVEARRAVGRRGATEAVAEHQPDWPRFRVGINTGPALIGNIGSDEFRNFTAIGDTVNLAAGREREVAEAGHVVLGPTTHAAIKHLAIARPRDPIEVKGKRDPVACWVLEGLKDAPTTWSPHQPPPPPPTLPARPHAPA